MKLTGEMRDKSAFVINLGLRKWTVFKAKTMGFYGIAGDMPPYWATTLLGYLDKKVDKQ